MTESEYHGESTIDSYSSSYGIVRNLQRAKAHRQVPRWSVPREAWIAALCSLSEKTQQTSISSFAQLFCDFIGTMIGLHQQPWIWAVSSTVQIPKSNSLPGCRGLRLIHLLDPIGKTWSRYLWDLTPHALGNSAIGFAKQRRREQAVLQLRCMLWELSRVGQPFVVSFYDVANAFPSVDHCALNKMLAKQCTPETALFLQQRYTNAHMLVTDSTQSECLFRIGSGDLQGDTTAPNKFVAVYESAICDWHRRTRTDVEQQGLFVGRDPVSGDRVELSRVAFA